MSASMSKSYIPPLVRTKIKLIKLSEGLTMGLSYILHLGARDSKNGRKKIRTLNKIEISLRYTSFVWNILMFTVLPVRYNFCSSASLGTSVVKQSVYTIKYKRPRNV
jgi:hypothetical protein